MTQAKEHHSPRGVELTKYRDNRTLPAVTLLSGEIIEKGDPQEVTIYLHAISCYRFPH